MSISAASSSIAVTDSTALQRERQTFRNLRRRLLDAALNRWFALNMEQSRVRRVLLTMLFIMTGVLFTYFASASEWKGHLRNLFVTLFSNPAGLETAGSELAKLIWRSVTDPVTLRYYPVLVLPFTLSLFFASRYLVDIFELKSFAVARNFVSEVALGGSENKLVIREAQISTDDEENSPIVRIGGPGKLSVALDSAVLVERPDGRPRVISPTSDDDETDDPPGNGYGKKENNQGSDNILEGFERIRRDVIDLRDQVSDITEINARTRDGIRVTVADVRFVFNVLRGNHKSTPTSPYPFIESAVNSLIYKKVNRALADPIKIHDKPKSYSQGEREWHIQIKSMISSELGKFISTRDLGEFLASIATPELDAVQEQERAVHTEKRRMVERSEKLRLPLQPPAPTFSARPFLSRLVSEFSESFKRQGEQRGVQAQWVGVGTWKMPDGVPSQVIPEKHLEAWRITVENKQRGDEDAIKQLKKDAEMYKIQQLIRNGPLNSHDANQSGIQGRDSSIRALIQSYREQIAEAMTSLQKFKQLRLRPSLVAAYYFLSQSAHFVPKPVPVSSPPNEERLYEILLAKVGGITDTIERLVELEHEFSPTATRETLLAQIIKNWERDLR